MNIEELQERIAKLKANDEQLLINHYMILGKISENQEFLSKLKKDAEKDKEPEQTSVV